MCVREGAVVWSQSEASSVGVESKHEARLGNASVG
jgi:hypothetical protein